MTLLNRLPGNIEDWNSWKLKCDTPFLAFELSGGAMVLIDTGNNFGVQLAKKEWDIWRNAHKTNSTTLSATYFPYSGLKIYEDCWADKLTIGNFPIRNIPVTQSHSGVALQFENYKATLGLFAFTRLEIILDYRNSTMYTRDVSNPTVHYQHNRVAAVFVPNNPAKDNDLIAHVVPNGIAHQAGIRDGDILLRIDDLNVTKWRTTPDILPLSRFWSKPHGTELKLKLKREENLFEVTVVLQSILPPKHNLANQKLDPTVKTPVELGKVQGTAGQL